MSARVENSWYVSYDECTPPSVRMVRATKTFASEAEAKRFARIKTLEGHTTLVAGTINPVMPKRIIASASIIDWLEEGSEG
jgi:hypothetical protein